MAARRHLRERRPAFRMPRVSPVRGSRQTTMSERSRIASNPPAPTKTGISASGFGVPRPGGDVEPELAQDTRRLARHRAVAEETDARAPRAASGRPPAIPSAPGAPGRSACGGAAGARASRHIRSSSGRRPRAPAWRAERRAARDGGRSRRPPAWRVSIALRLGNAGHSSRLGRVKARYSMSAGSPISGPDPHLQIGQLGLDGGAPVLLRAHHQVDYQQCMVVLIMPLRHTVASQGCSARGRPGGAVVVAELIEARPGGRGRARSPDRRKQP